MKRGILIAVLGIILFGAFVSGAERVGTGDVTMCCEKTNSGLYCQDVLEKDCDVNAGFALPTACESTGPCDPGYCYDEKEGTCLDNVPQMVCNKEGGIWSAEKPAACGLGCCVLGDQASFVTLVRCKRLSAFYGLETNYNPDIQNEALCILAARSDERGACVYEEDFETTCEMTTRSQCGQSQEEEGRETNVVFETGLTPAGETEGEEEEGSQTTDDAVQQSPMDGCTVMDDNTKFCPGMLCSAPELQTNCGKSKQTTCIEGREEVYFVDTCGNPANIYDASKINDNNYWTYLIDKSETCGVGAANINSQTCGNCNYMLGSFCAATGAGMAKPTYGTNVCIDLNCPASDMTNGVEKLHGESWCGFDTDREFTFQENNQAGAFAQLLGEALGSLGAKMPIGAAFKGGDSPVGSKFYRYLCSHGEVIVEPCADFRQEECIENNVAGYSEAACRVNRWQDCTSIFKRDECENYDRRDCVWMDGMQYVLMGGLGNGSALDKSSMQAAKGELAKIRTGERELGACVPKNPPGLTFWGSEEGDNAEAGGICSQANAMCPVTYEKGISGDWECVENCECLSQEVELARVQVCMAMGDCGPKVNYVGASGRTMGYRIFEEELKKK